MKSLIIIIIIYLIIEYYIPKKNISVSRNVLKAGCVIWYENASKATFRSVYIIVYFDVNEVKIIRSSINTLLHVVTIMTLNFFLKYPYVCTIMH